MRDDSLDTPIPDRFPVSDYHVKAKASAIAALAKLEGMTVERRVAFGEKRKAELLQCYENGSEKNRVENARLEEMERQVSGWTPPSRDHEGLKTFMLQQIGTSRHNTDYYATQIADIRTKSPGDYFNEAVAKEKRDIEYHTKEHKGEVERSSERNEWVRLLRQSLNP